MAEVERFLQSMQRIRFACLSREAVAPSTGRRLTAHQANLLGLLDVQDPSMVSELAQHMGVTQSTMSLTLKRLEAAGFVSRERDPVDRRVTNIRLTPEGAELRDAHSLLDPQRIVGVLGMLDPHRRRTALHAMATLADAADAYVARGRDYVEALIYGDDE